MTNHPSTTFAGFILIAASLSASAQNLLPFQEEENTQIAWASEIFATNLMSDGVTTFEASGQSIRFELGTFATGFDPRNASPQDWLDNWIILQGTDYDPIENQFINTATLHAGDPAFTAGGQAYIWGYNSKDPEIMDSTGWLIVGSPLWTWPSTSAPLPSVFSMSDATNADVLIGSVNGSGYHMQLATPVPEPATPLMLALAGVSFAMRRRR